MSRFVKGGVIRSRHDHRDYAAEEIFHTERLAGSPESPFQGKTLPDEYFLFDEDSGSNLLVGGNPVYNQGASYKCVSYVGCTIREKQVFNEGLSDKRRITFSKDFLYDMRSNAHSEGMSGADLMNILAKYGTVEEGDYDQYLKLYNDVHTLERRKRTESLDHSSIEIIDEMIHEAQEKINSLFYKIRTDANNSVYARINTVTGLKESLVYNGPCLIILPFYGNPDSIQFWLPSASSTGGVDEMGHAVTVMGYSDSQQAFYLRNTWGPRWNGCGHVWFPYSSLKIAWETWTIFPNGTNHLVYHKKRLAAATIDPKLIIDPKLAINTIQTPIAGCKCAHSKRSGSIKSSKQSPRKIRKILKSDSTVEPRRKNRTKSKRILSESDGSNIVKASLKSASSSSTPKSSSSSTPKSSSTSTSSEQSSHKSSDNSSSGNSKSSSNSDSDNSSSSSNNKSSSDIGDSNNAKLIRCNEKSTTKTKVLADLIKNILLKICDK